MCCYVCYNLKQKTLWIGWLNFSYCSLAIIVFAIGQLTSEHSTDDGKKWYEQSQQGLVTTFIIDVIWMMSIVFLLIGAYVETRAKWMLPWVFVTLLNIIAFIVLGIYDAKLGNYAPLIASVVSAAPLIYCAHIVWSYYFEVTSDDDTRSDVSGKSYVSGKSDG